MKLRMLLLAALAALSGTLYVAAGDIVPMALAPQSQVAEAGLSNCEAYESPANSNKAWGTCYAYAGPNPEWVRVQGQCFQKTNPFVVVLITGAWTSSKYPSRSGANCSTATHDLYRVRWQLLNSSGVIVVTSVWRNV